MARSDEIVRAARHTGQRQVGAIALSVGAFLAGGLAWGLIVAGGILLVDGYVASWWER